MANLAAGQHRRRRPARAEPARRRRRGRQGRRRRSPRRCRTCWSPTAQRIALYVTGRVPIRRAGDGSAPVPGDGSHDWIGWASGDQLPHYVAPASGRLVNANDRIAPPDFPVFLGRDWFGDWRARRIRELLDRSDRLTAGRLRPHADRRAVQLRPPGAAGAARRAARRRTPRGRAQALLRDWDGSMTMDAPQPLIFNAWIARVLRPRAARRPASPPATAARSPSSSPTCCRRRARIGAAATAPPLLQASLADAVHDLAARFGNDPATWRWGEAHPGGVRPSAAARASRCSAR